MEKRKLLEAKAVLRRSRRNRKTRYRHPKNRVHTKRVYVEKPILRNGHMTHWKKIQIGMESSRPKGWLPPSVQSKVDHHFRIIHAYQRALPPSVTTTIELGQIRYAENQESGHSW